MSGVRIPDLRPGSAVALTTKTCPSTLPAPEETDRVTNCDHKGKDDPSPLYDDTVVCV